MKRQLCSQRVTRCCREASLCFSMRTKTSYFSACGVTMYHGVVPMVILLHKVLMPSGHIKLNIITLSIELHVHSVELLE